MQSPTGAGSIYPSVYYNGYTIQAIQSGSWPDVVHHHVGMCMISSHLARIAA